MDFHTLMNIASAKQESKDKIKISRYNLDLPPAKKEVKDVAHSDVVKRLIQEKDNEKNIKEKALREREKAEEHERKKKAQFRIPKKKEPEPKVVDTEKLIDSLFEDTEEETPLVNGQDTSRLSPVDLEQKSKTVSNHASKPSHSKSDDKTSSTLTSSSSSSKDKSSSSSSKDKSTSSSSKDKSSSSSSRDKSSSSSSKDKSSSSSSKDKSSSSSSKDKSSSSSSSRDKEKSSRDKHKSSHESSKSSQSHSGDKKSHSSSHHSSSKSSSSKQGTKSSSSSGSKSSSSTSKSSSSDLKPQSSSSKSQLSSSNHKSSSSPKSESSSSSLQPKPSAEQPITLAKHHLKPVAERHVDSTQMTEKEIILAKLQAIKERTLAAINKEQEGKRKRSRGEKTSRKSKEGEKEDERVKSKEIVKDIYSSEEETENNDIPSVLDIMLSEHQTRLERDKISRMAKQAWERATKKENGDSMSSMKKKKHKRSISVKPTNHHRKRKDHSLSPDPREHDRKRPKPNEELRKKTKIVRHAGHAAPPPPNFQAILAMAEQKTKELPKPLPTIPKKKKKEEETRPMTQEEKDRKERTQSKEYQHWLKHGGKYPNNGNISSSDEDEKESAKVKDKIMPSKQHRKEIDHSVASDGKKNNMPLPIKGDNKKPYPVSSSKSKEITVNENVLVCGPAEDEDSDEGRNSRPSNPFDQIFKSVHKKKSAQPAPTKRHLENDDLESEESDLDGFIDSGDEEAEDYSKHISKIFGYNKNRYADEDDDLSDMEANFATVMKEEQRSAKLGRMEDLEDMRKEEEELKRKALMKKKMRR